MNGKPMSNDKDGGKKGIASDADLVREALKSKRKRDHKGNTNDDNDKRHEVTRDSVLDPFSFLPIPYLNFLLNFVVLEGYITHQNPKIEPTVSMHLFDAEISSFLHSKLKPCIRRRTSLTYHWMGGANIRSKKRKPKMYFISNESKVAFTWRNTLKDVDFVISEEASQPGYLRIHPVNPNVWDGCVLALVDNTICFKQTIAGLNTSTKATVGFKCGWPAKASEWITRRRLNNFPSSADIERIVALGCKIVPATIGNDIEWEYSFHTNERVFFTGIVTKKQRSLMLLVTSIIDHLHDLDDTEYDEILKSVFLYAFEEIPNQAFLENPSFCVFKITDMILDGLRVGFLPNYFMRCKNILSGRSHIDLERILEPMVILRNNPMSSLYFLLDSFGYSGTSFGLIFDVIIRDFHAVESEADISRRFDEFSAKVPALTQTGTEMVELEQAVCLIERMTQSRQGINSSQILSLFDQICASFIPVQMWCVLFTSERLTGRPVAQLISCLFETVNIVEIFGSHFTALIGDIQIPKKFSYGINMVCFVSSFTDLISVIWPYERAMAVGLRYFLLHKAHEPQSILPDLNDYVSFSVQEQSMSMMMYMSLYVVYVTNLYRHLYNIAVRFRERGLLVDMLGSLERFCDLTSPLNQYELLADFYQFVGDENKACQARSKAACTCSANNTIDSFF